MKPADVLVIAAGALGTGQLINGQDILSNTAATTIGNVIGPFTIAQSSTTGDGTGATITVTGDGANALSAVTVAAIGTGYADTDTITISEADLQAQGFTGAVRGFSNNCSSKYGCRFKPRGKLH